MARTRTNHPPDLPHDPTISETCPPGEGALLPSAIPEICPPGEGYRLVPVSLAP